MRRLLDNEADRTPRHPRRALVLLAIGIAATFVCLLAELWLMLELLHLLPEGTAEPADIERLADIGKWIAGATGATLLVRGLLDRAARHRHIGVWRIAMLAVMWIVITVGIHRSLVIVTDAIVDSLPQVARQDAVLIALYRKNVQDGTIGDPDFSPGSGGTLDDLQRVKAINAAIGLLDRERDYARRSESVIRDSTQARKEQIVRAAEAEATAVRARLDAAREPFAELAEGRPSPAALAAWNAYDSLWKMPPNRRAAAAANGTLEIVPAWPDSPIRALRLSDIAPGLAPETFGRFIAAAIATRRDTALWMIEDRVLGALERINRSTSVVLDPIAERQLVLSIVVPPLALSFGAIGIIANATALILLVGSLTVAGIGRLRSGGTLRALRLASVIVPWLAVTGSIAFAPPVPFADEGRGFSRIARETNVGEAPLWASLWLRMIGIEARLLGSMPGRS
jgi:hypothetical protein